MEITEVVRRVTHPQARSQGHIMCHLHISHDPSSPGTSVFFMKQNKRLHQLQKFQQVHICGTEEIIQGLQKTRLG